MTRKRAVESEYVGVHDAEVITGISAWTWRRWAYARKVASVKLKLGKKRLLIPRAEIDRMVAEGHRPALADVK
jgi:hypothetical protein